MSQRLTTKYDTHAPAEGPLRTMTIDELAGRTFGLRVPTPGMNYARKADYTEKEQARNAVLQLFTKDQWYKGLSILTMPGLHWSFEKQLLLMRERRKRALGDHGKRPERTYIASIERDEAIYRAAMNWIPGGKHSLAQLPTTADRSLALRTHAIARYHRISFEDFVAAPWTKPHDAAWLDFNGPITSQRLEKICRFWHDRIRWRLVLTWMNARYDAEAIKQIGEVGGHSDDSGFDCFTSNDVSRPQQSPEEARRNGRCVFDWIEKALRRNNLSIRVLHRISYRDTSPMLQLAVEKC